METHKTSVVVGFDASPDAKRALSWAVEFARLRERPLRVVVARGDLYTVSKWADDWTRGLAEEWVGTARKLLAEQGAEAELSIVDGLPPEALIRESASAAAVVVGSRGHGALTGALQGSVSQQVSRHAECPVVVVRHAADEQSRRVVVGVDGSASSIEALEFALQHAALHELTLAVIYAPERWHGVGYGQPVAIIPELVAEFEAHEAAVLRQIAAEIARHPGVEVDVQKVTGRPARALADASHSAALVVVGSRGRGAFAAMLLGSVSAEVLRQAACPIAVVR